MDDYIAAIAGVQLTLVGEVLLGTNSYWGLFGVTLIFLGTVIVGTVAYDDLTSR